MNKDPNLIITGRRLGKGTASATGTSDATASRSCRDPLNGRAFYRSVHPNQDLLEVFERISHSGNLEGMPPTLNAVSSDIAASPSASVKAQTLIPKNAKCKQGPERGPACRRPNGCLLRQHNGHFLDQH